MTECKRCRALEVRKGQTKGYVTVHASYFCALGHKVTIKDNKVVCADDECTDKTTRRKS